jgi:methylglutaconyl-CoA hydratase
MDYGNPETLAIERREDGVLQVRLNRPEVHNAFNSTLIAELRQVFAKASADPDVRAALLCGSGKSFSAGADVAWMRAQGEADFASNRQSAVEMASMFQAIWACDKPVVASVHGAALGGGTGLVAACDLAIAGKSAVFGFTEVRLGILPAVIAPYVIEKLGSARARALFLLGSVFDAEEAQRVGLVFRACEDQELADQTEAYLRELLEGGPAALAAAKQLTHTLAARRLADDLEQTADWIARIRGTAEGKEGLQAFLDKRRPSWLESR